jgi:hypothetical protein
MSADHLFYQPGKIIFKGATTNQVDLNRLIIGVVMHSEAKAYPIRFIGYHHQVMDHYNAMLEDATTHSWWRQVTGEAIIGPRKGQHLPEVFSQQSSLAEWLKQYPLSLIMQADSTYIDEYSNNTDYETGKSRKELTGTDTLSWKPKSWVVGVTAGKHTKAYDWNRLKVERIIQDHIHGTPVLIVMNQDTAGFYAFERPNSLDKFMLNDNVLTLGNHHFKINGKGIDTTFNLKVLPAYQEFWHSWSFFHRETAQ